jgi:hypothetical protein
MAILFDHLVRGRKQSRRNLNAKLFCGPEINEQVKFGWLLEREFGGVGAVENLLVGRGVGSIYCAPQITRLTASP